MNFQILDKIFLFFSSVSFGKPCIPTTNFLITCFLCAFGFQILISFALCRSFSKEAERNEAFDDVMEIYDKAIELGMNLFFCPRLAVDESQYR